METLAICRICLNNNVQHVVKNLQLQEIYERLTRIPFQSDMRPLAVCYICYAQLRASHRFKLKCLRAEQLLAQMLDQRQAGDEVLDPIQVDPSAHNLSFTTVVQISIDNTEQDFDFDRIVERIIYDDDVKSAPESEQDLPDPVDTLFKEYVDTELEEEVKTVKKKLRRPKDLEIDKQKLLAEVASDLETEEKMEVLKMRKKRKPKEDDHSPPALKKQFVEVPVLQDKQHYKSVASELPELVMEPRLRAIPEQFSILIDFMERHGDLSRPGPGPRGRIKCDRLWTELTHMLNSLGGGVQKSSDKWRKVWADWKTKSKKKYLSLKLQASRKSGPCRIHLNPLEKRVVAVIGSTVTAESAKELPLEHAQYALDNVDCVLEDHGTQNIAIPTTSAAILTEDLPQPEEEIATPAPPPCLPPPPPHTPPARNNRRRAFRARRNRGLTPCERTARLFATIEKRRLEHDEARDKRLDERESERLRLEAERIDVTREHNRLLHQLCLLVQRLIDVITQRGSLLPTER